jgi:tetratricopeptide (TPR) repeat protein
MDRILRVVPWAGHVGNSLGQVGNLSYKVGNLSYSCLLAAVLIGLAVQAAWATPNGRDGGGVTRVEQGPELVSPAPPLKRLPQIEEPSQMPPTATAPPAAWPSIARLPKVEAAPSEMAPATIPLKAAEPLGERSEQMERVARQADEQTHHGFDLAGRGAYFAARSEFLGALRLIAEGLDTEEKTDAHRRALAAALTAMKEAEDFLPCGSRSEAVLDLPGIIAAHATPVLKNEAKDVTSLTALNRYFTFAQGQFAAAAGREVAGSMALHGLGKLHTALARKKISLATAAEPKAMVYYQAAILVYPQNSLSANDLGVLLAQCGDYSDARTMLEYSLALSRQSATCWNLAVVYGQLGQAALADRAGRFAATLEQTEAARRKTAWGTANNSVRWIDPQTFATTSANAPNYRR